MNIGTAAKACGLPVKTVRYYDEIDLVSPARNDNGYRAYSEDDIHKLRFLQRARRLGFTIGECRHLLSLYEDKSRASAEVRALAVSRISEIDARIEELRSLRDSLENLVSACRGDDRPDCPILDDLAGDGGHCSHSGR